MVWLPTGNAEWEDGNHTSLRIIWKTPEALAGEVYHWALQQEVAGTVFTLYELHSGEENQDSGKDSNNRPPRSTHCTSSFRVLYIALQVSMDAIL